MAFKLPSLFKKKEPPIKEPKIINIEESPTIDLYLNSSESERLKMCQEECQFLSIRGQYNYGSYAKTWYLITELKGLDFEFHYTLMNLYTKENRLTEKHFVFQYINGEIIIGTHHISWDKFYRTVLMFRSEMFIRIPDLAADMVDEDLVFYHSEPVLKTERTKFTYFYRDVLRNKIFGFSDSLRLMSAPYSYREEKLELFAKKRIVESYNHFRFPIMELRKMVEEGYRVIYPETHMEGLVELYLCYIELTFMQDLVIFFKNNNDDYIGIRNSESDYSAFNIPLENKVNEEIHKRVSVHGEVPFQLGRRKG